MKKMIYLILVLNILGCKGQEDSFDKTNKFLNFYVVSPEYRSLPAGFNIIRSEEGELEGKFFTIHKKIHDITFYEVSKDSLVFSANDGRRKETFILTDINLIDKTAKVITRTNKKGDNLIFGTRAEQDLIDYDEDFYFKVIGKENTNTKKDNLPKYSEIRGVLINSKDPNEADKLLGKPNEVFQKNLLTYSLYYFGATQNSKKIHVRVVYDHRNNLVDEVTSHELGAKITGWKI
ncbi:hypothetical protein Q4Q39_17420 [Flavivirga amylovorans]|uniref:Lipoprotein n=1 Tax=Flavivirga amylovorans TaxID=870486 RepID=A0ABT8X5S7_9FLAO|nr:hypothetical protein [Flavivirga amylovorans]MDO5989187.1 hypothetical protein [Flavivirga amylovorans]